MLPTVFLIQCCQFLLVSKSCHFLRKSSDHPIILDYFLLKENQFGFLTVLNNTMSGNNNTGFYHQYHKTLTTPVFLYFHFSYLYMFLAGNKSVYTPRQGTKKRKVFHTLSHQSQESRLWRETNNFSIHIFLHRTRLFHLSTENGRT